ncbi:phage tail-collar fiber domain-containing protein [Pseudoalteromonas gelatinilytica]
MSQLQITNAGIDYRNAVFAGEEVQNITHFVFANKQGQDASAPIDPNTAIPAHVLHTQPVKAVSKVDGNAIVISAVLGYDIGDFEYNWYGVVATKANNEQVLIAVVTTELQTKTKTVGAVTGNYSVKSIVWRSQNIADDLNITLAVLPWQVQEEELVSKAVFDAHNHDDSYLKQVDAEGYAHKFKANVFSKTQQIDTTGTALIIGGSSKQSGEDVSVYFGNDGIDQYGYYFTYVGSGSGNETAFEITATNKGSPNKALRITQDGVIDLSQLDAKVAGNIIWHAGNMGAGSGLDADTLRGLYIHQLARTDVKTDFKKGVSIGGDIVAGSNALLQVNGFIRTGSIYLSEGLSAEGESFALENINGGLYWNSNELFHKGNMGTGSGLDADTVDGLHSSDFVKIDDIIDNLRTSAPHQPLSARQGLVLKGFIDNINSIIQSDDATLDDLQEIVDYIKINKSTLEALSIESIAGLQNAIDSKFDKVDADKFARKDTIETFTGERVTFSIDTEIRALGGLEINTSKGLKFLRNTSSGNGDDCMTLEVVDSGVFFEIDNTSDGGIGTYVFKNKDTDGTSRDIFVLDHLRIKYMGFDVWHAGNMGDGSDLDAGLFAGERPEHYAKSEELNSFIASRVFTRSNTLSVMRRHSLEEGSYATPVKRNQTDDLQDGDWFAVRATSGEPILNIPETKPTKFKRLADSAIDTQVTIVADDKNERIFVYNSTDDVWEF